MSLDRFINTVRTEVAKRFDLKTDAEIDAFFIGMEESAKDNQEALEKRDKMLRDTVAELCEAKRLLKAAVEDIVWLNEHTVDGEGQCLIETATDMETCLACPLNVNNPHVCGWKHQVEALALIGEDGDTNG